MGKTNISWATDVWNPVTGCTQASPGCAHCYAKDLAEGRLKRLYPEGFGKVQMHPEKLDQPLRWRKPRRIFVNSMSDLFHPDVPDEFIFHVWSVMAVASQHTFQILTKRPERMHRRLQYTVCKALRNGVSQRHSWQWPLPNVWLGVSVENQYWAEQRIPLLLRTPAAMRFVSGEPLLGPLDLSAWLDPGEWGHETGGPQGWQPEPSPIDWFIVGAESGPKRRPMDLDWAKDIRDQCVEAGVPFFFKQGSGLRPGQNRELDGRTWEETP